MSRSSPANPIEEYEPRRRILHQAGRGYLPLPKGEGWGEGERDVRTPMHIDMNPGVRSSTKPAEAISLKGEGRGEGERDVRTPMRIDMNPGVRSSTKPAKCGSLSPRERAGVRGNATSELPCTSI